MLRVFLLCLMVALCLFRIGNEQVHWTLSFFPLYGLSFIIDSKFKMINWKKISFVEAFTYLVLLPIALAGVIIRPTNFVQQWRQPFRIDHVRWNWVVIRICRGVFEKFVIAAHVLKAIRSHFVNVAHVSDGSQGFVTLLFVLLLVPAVYFEIGGTTNIARAIAEIIGLKAPVNFIAPWKSKNLIEYWQRWNVTVSSWVRDYLFFPILSVKSIKSLGKPTLDIALILSFSIFGLWHGLTWPCFFGDYFMA